MSDYKKMVQTEANEFHKSVGPEFESDSTEHGGKSASPNLTLWLDRNSKLLNRIKELAEKWTRAESDFIKSQSRHAVAYGDPRDSASFAYYKDVLAELKKLRKK
ncbi:MAG: hypothetical protein ACKVX7_14030 [Planctomycetota bacterium]